MAGDERFLVGFVWVGLLKAIFRELVGAGVVVARGGTLWIGFVRNWFILAMSNSLPNHDQLTHNISKHPSP